MNCKACNQFNIKLRSIHALQPGGGSRQQSSRRSAQSVRKHSAPEFNRGNTCSPITVDANHCPEDLRIDKTNQLKWLPTSQYKRLKTSIKKQSKNVVFNYSTIQLSQAMERVLNKGLKFVITPLKLDITQVLTDFRRFERTMIWKEFWFGKESEPYNPPIFRKKNIIFRKTIGPQRNCKTFWLQSNLKSLILKTGIKLQIISQLRKKRPSIH